MGFEAKISVFDEVTAGERINQNSEIRNQKSEIKNDGISLF
jgi:hypothetical protein